MFGCRDTPTAPAALMPNWPSRWTPQARPTGPILLLRSFPARAQVVRPIIYSPNIISFPLLGITTSNPSKPSRSGRAPLHSLITSPTAFSAASRALTGTERNQIHSRFAPDGPTYGYERIL